jgi:hypothetical protein
MIGGGEVGLRQDGLAGADDSGGDQYGGTCCGCCESFNACKTSSLHFLALLANAAFADAHDHDVGLQTEESEEDDYHVGGTGTASLR